jgi:hypothetical protein
VSEIWERFAAAMGDEDFSGPQYASSPYKFGNLGKEDAKDAG